MPTESKMSVNGLLPVLEGFVSEQVTGIKERMEKKEPSHKDCSCHICRFNELVTDDEQKLMLLNSPFLTTHLSHLPDLIKSSKLELPSSFNEVRFNSFLKLVTKKVESKRLGNIVDIYETIMTSYGKSSYSEEDILNAIYNREVLPKANAWMNVALSRHLELYEENEKVVQRAVILDTALQSVQVLVVGIIVSSTRIPLSKELLDEAFRYVNTIFSPWTSHQYLYKGFIEATSQLI